MYDLNELNLDYITSIEFKKASSRFKYDEMLDDSQCSEDYDEDMFFNGTELTLIKQNI